MLIATGNRVMNVNEKWSPSNHLIKVGVVVKSGCLASHRTLGCRFALAPF